MPAIRDRRGEPPRAPVGRVDRSEEAIPFQPRSARVGSVQEQRGFGWSDLVLVERPKFVTGDPIGETLLDRRQIAGLIDVSWKTSSVQVRENRLLRLLTRRNARCQPATRRFHSEEAPEETHVKMPPNTRALGDLIVACFA